MTNCGQTAWRNQHTPLEPMLLVLLLRGPGIRMLLIPPPAPPPPGPCAAAPTVAEGAAAADQAAADGEGPEWALGAGGRTGNSHKPSLRDWP